MGQVISIGKQDYVSLRENHYFYIDKTDFIRQWWKNADDITLITRPRRFGKTLNMSMLNCFFSRQYAERGDRFEGLSIWEEEKYRELQGTYPVIFISFADVKQNNYEDAVQKIKNIVYENISNPEFSISETLKNTGYNIDYARRCFFRETGFTPKEYLLNLRLSYAKKLLLQDNFISVEWVAFTCGFNDAFYFSALFKKRFGLSPRTYRNRRLLTPQQPLP